MGIILNRRRVMGGKKLPYDAEIEYLESSGTQYIDTGIPGDISGNYYEVGYMRTYYKSPETDGIIGTHNQTVPYNRAYIATRESQWELGYGDFGLTGRIYNNVYYDIVLDVTNNIYKLIVNQSTIFETTYISNRSTANIYILTVYQLSSDFASVGKLYYARIYNSNKTLIADLIPVVKDGVGYMYDKVSGQLFGNAGTGDFILGPDV